MVVVLVFNGLDRMDVYKVIKVWFSWSIPGEEISKEQEIND